LAWAVAVLVAGTACRSKKPSSSAPSASASASASAAPTAARCHSVTKGAGLVVGNASGPAKAPDGDEDPELPFSTAIGSAVTLSSGFAVSGVTARDGGTEAFVAFVPQGGPPGRIVFLGAVHGDPDPPIVAADGDRVLVGVENSDASGRVIELFRLGKTDEKVTRGPEITGAGDVGFGLAASAETGVVVFGAGKGSKLTLKSATLGRAPAFALGTATDIAGTSDAESPVLRARPGGFWLAWIAEPPAVDAGAPGADASAEETRPLDALPRVLTVALLGADGTPSGAARAVSDPASRVVAFDAATLADGALALAWREDDAGPGGETGGSELARLAPDGAIQRGRAADETLSAGAPSLVREPGPAGRIWLLVPGEDDRLRMALLAPSAVSTSPFSSDDSLRGAEILAAQAGKPCGKESCASFLVARPIKRAVELAVVECRL
jgi:hypothetical protein